jgi:hypothetical protein
LSTVDAANRMQAEQMPPAPRSASSAAPAGSSPGFDALANTVPTAGNRRQSPAGLLHLRHAVDGAADQKSGRGDRPRAFAPGMNRPSGALRARVPPARRPGDR